MIESGPFYNQNFKRIQSLNENDWRVAITKCKVHVQWKLRQKTLYGAHAPKTLGTDPIAYYVEIASEKIISGEWEWKEKFSLSEQMIRIADSYISKQVEKSKTKKAWAMKISYSENMEFYEIEDEFDESLETDYLARYSAVERAVAGDADLEQLWECVKAGFKRIEISEFMVITPKQFDKLKERLFDRVKSLTTNR